jgi:hypothetical protein
MYKAPRLPLDVLYFLTEHGNYNGSNVDRYRGLLALGRFARSTLGEDRQMRIQRKFMVCIEDTDVALMGERVLGLKHNKVWMLNNMCHNLDGPAIVANDGRYRAWCKYGDYHRLNGPAVTYYSPVGGYMEEYWMEGVRVTL